MDDSRENPFAAFARDMESPKARAYRERKSAKLVMTEKEAERQRAPTATEKRVREKRTLAAAYRKWKADELRELLAGPWGLEIVRLRKFIRRLALDDAPTLIAHVAGLPWIPLLSPARLRSLRSMVAHGVLRLRLRNGLPPFDDGIPFADHPDRAGTILLRMMR